MHSYLNFLVEIVYQLIAFFIDIVNPYLSVVAVITTEPKSSDVQALIFFFSSDINLIFPFLSSLIFALDEPWSTICQDLLYSYL